MVEVQENESTIMKKLLQNSDLFGGESDSESDSSPPAQHNVSRPPLVPEKEEPKKKRRKPKEPREPKPRKLKKIDVQQIHSDSQRMVRESSLNLPKYQPKAKDINSFLTRVRSRKPQSAPVVAAIKSTPFEEDELEKGLHINKENSSSCDGDEDSLPPVALDVPTTHPTANDNHINDNTADYQMPSDHVTTADYDLDNTLQDDQLENNNSSDFRGTTTLPDERKTPDKDVDLSFNGDISPTAPNLHPEPEKQTTKVSKSKQQPAVYTKQTTITNLFTAKKQPDIESTKEEPSSETMIDSMAPPSLKPQLSSMDDFLFEKDKELTIELKPEKELTPLEKFQQRYTKHQITKVKVKVEPIGEEKTPLVSEEMVAKLGDKPGAIRQHLLCKLREQVSQQKAVERREAEEVRKMYNEEVEEDEGEMTDCDTTDEEYEQNSELAAAESDVCSVLDEDEQINEAPCRDEGPGLSNQNSNKEGDSNSDDDDVIVPTLVKKKSFVNRILDSDDEDEIETPTDVSSTQPVSCTDHTTDTRSILGSNSTIPKPETYRSFPSSEYSSMSLFDSATTSTSDLVHNETSKKDAVERRQSFLMNQEASMPPLMLNVSSESEDSDNDNERGSPIQNDVSGRFAGSGSTFGLPKDSGMGTMTRMVDDEDSQLTGDAARDSISESLETSALGEKDSSMEMSFRWPDGPSLPPAQPQPRRENSTGIKGLGFSEETFDPQSQWEEAQALPPVSMSTNTQASQDVCVDEGTQFLDADGFLCVRKEKRHTHSSSAIHDSLDPTQGSSPTELLGLCSGQFEETRDPPSPRRRLSSDSNSTQGVRELLGLATKPKAVGISGLLSGDRGDGVEAVTGGLTFNSTQGFSQFNEVVGLCSGAFPTTQATGNIGRPLQSVLGGDESQNAVLNWATKQKEGDGYYGDSESEDEDMPLIKKKRVKLKVKNSNSDRLAEFVESEAELSGSDMGPDEDDEILAEEEEGLYGYREDEGGQSDVPLSDSELWDQVNKAHMKHTMADDNADLRDIKERFLKEGDLYEDGLALKNGFFRTRRFTKQSSEVGSVDLFSEGVGEGNEMGVALEGEEFSSQAEAHRRKDRLEREEFMTKCREKDNGLLAIDEDSQSILSIIVDNSSQSAATTPLLVKQMPRLTTPSLSSGGYKHTRGSFLKHDSNTLRRLSSFTAATPKAGGGTNGFVFHKKLGVTGDEQVDSKRKVQPKKSFKRLLSVEKSNESKRPKLDRSISAPSDTTKHSSIFSMFK